MINLLAIPFLEHSSRGRRRICHRTGVDRRPNPGSDFRCRGLWCGDSEPAQDPSIRHPFRKLAPDSRVSV